MNLLLISSIFLCGHLAVAGTDLGQTKKDDLSHQLNLGFMTGMTELCGDAYQLKKLGLHHHHEQSDVHDGEENSTHPPMEREMGEVNKLDSRLMELILETCEMFDELEEGSEPAARGIRSTRQGRGRFGRRGQGRMGGGGGDGQGRMGGGGGDGQGRMGGGGGDGQGRMGGGGGDGQGRMGGGGGDGQGRMGGGGGDGQGRMGGGGGDGRGRMGGGSGDGRGRMGGNGRDGQGRMGGGDGQGRMGGGGGDGQGQGGGGDGQGRMGGGGGDGQGRMGGGGGDSQGRMGGGGGDGQGRMGGGGGDGQGRMGGGGGDGQGRMGGGGGDGQGRMGGGGGDGQGRMGGGGGDGQGRMGGGGGDGQGRKSGMSKSESNDSLPRRVFNGMVKQCAMGELLENEIYDVDNPDSKMEDAVILNPEFLEQLDETCDYMDLDHKLGDLITDLLKKVSSEEEENVPARSMADNQDVMDKLSHICDNVLDITSKKLTVESPNARTVLTSIEKLKSVCSAMLEETSTPIVN